MALKFQMKNFQFYTFLLLLSLGLMMSNCTKTQIESTPPTISMSNYYPLTVGKWIHYRLDSTVYTSLNTIKTVRTYYILDSIEAKITDNNGNDLFRIRRMMRDNIDTTRWKDNATFLVTPSSTSIQFSENNLKFTKLVNPVREFISWKGNSAIDVADNFLRFYENWDYTYENVGQPLTINNINFPETITVNQIDQTNGDPNNKNYYYSITKSSEIYAKGIGLVYKNFLYEVWQPTAKNYESNCYGVKLTIKSHNF
jgi:hypothetical protein